jgi:hypothetical protein
MSNVRRRDLKPYVSPGCSSRCRRRLSGNLREPRVEAGPGRCTCSPHGQRRPRNAGFIERPNSYEYQMRSRLSLAEEWRTARPAEPPTHAISAIGDTEVVSGLSGRGEGRGTEARVHSPATCAKVLAVATPAHSSYYRQLRTRPVNGTAEASTGYRHRVVHPAKTSRMIAGRSAAGKLRPSGARGMGLTPNPSVERTFQSLLLAL